MRLARPMLAMGMLGSSATYPEVTAYYSSPGGAGDYMDAATNAAARAIFSGSAPVGTVGCWVRFPSQPFIFTRALSAAEIAALYAQGPTADIRNVTGLAAFLWRDADTAGSVANVGTGGACALTFNGSVTSEAL